MDKINKQRLEQLVRQGIVPSNKLPMLMQAMSNLHMGKQLQPVEREVLAKYMFNMTDIMLKDTTVFNRAKLHTQRTKYHTEETTVDLEEKMVDGVEILDGPESEEKNKMKKEKKKEDMKCEEVDPDEEERTRKKHEQKAKRLSVKSRQKFRMLPKEIRKEKEKAGLDEEIAKINEDYKAMFEATLEVYGVDNIRDIPADQKKEFFSIVDAALEEAKMAKKDHDGDGKIETSTAEYMGSRDKAIKKSIKLKGFGPDSSKSNMSNPAARAALMRKEEVERIDETEQLDEYGNPAATPDRLAMIRKAVDRVQSGQAAKEAEKRAKADMKQKGAQKGMAPVKVKKPMKEQVSALRKIIKEGTTKEKVEAFKELNTIIEQFKTTGEL